MEINNDNVVVKLRAFTTMDSITSIKSYIALVMLRKAYLPTQISVGDFNRINEFNIQYFLPSGQSIFFQYGQLSAKLKTSKFDMIVEKLSGKRSEAKVLNINEYLSILKNIIPTAPVFVEFIFTPFSYSVDNEKRIGTNIEISSTPAILAQADRRLIKHEVTENEYTNIIAYNKNFLENLAKELGLQITENARVNSAPIKSGNLFSAGLLSGLSYDVSQFFIEANGCYTNDLTRACAAMIRAGIDASVTRKITDLGYKLELYHVKGQDQINLPSKLDLLSNHVKGIKNDANMMKDIKWMGDIALHNPNNKVELQDIHLQIKKIEEFLYKLSRIEKVGNEYIVK